METKRQLGSALRLAHFALEADVADHSQAHGSGSAISVTSASSSDCVSAPTTRLSLQPSALASLGAHAWLFRFVEAHFRLTLDHLIMITHANLSLASLLHLDGSRRWRRW